MYTAISIALSNNVCTLSYTSRMEVQTSGQINTIFNFFHLFPKKYVDPIFQRTEFLRNQTSMFSGPLSQYVSSMDRCDLLKKSISVLGLHGRRQQYDLTCIIRVSEWRGCVQSEIYPCESNRQCNIHGLWLARGF